MKKLIVCLFLCLPIVLLAQTQTADDLYEAGNFTQALTAYQQQAKQASGPDMYKAQLRVIASQYMLGQYMNAATTAFTTQFPQTEPLWQARLLLYRIKTAQRVQHTYYAGLPIEDEDNAQDFSQLSASQWQDKINESFQSLWALRQTLVYAPLEKETLILEIKDADLQAIPTLFDFVVLQWKEELANKAPATPLRAENLLTLDYKAPATEKLDIQLLAHILAQAAKLGGKNRDNARLIWEAQRLTLPFDYPSFFTFKESPDTLPQTNSPEHAQAIKLLLELSGYQETPPTLFQKISQLLRLTKADYGKAYAALKAANMLNDEKQYAQAVAVCDWSLSHLTSSYYTQSCAQLAQQIRQPVLAIEQTHFVQDPAHTKVNFTLRNATALYMRLYAITEADLASWNQENSPRSWDYLTYIASNKIPALLARTPISKMMKPVAHNTPHAFTQDTLQLPELPARGFYAAAFSYDKNFDPDTAPVQVLVLNNTALALFVSTAIEDDSVKYHTIQANTFSPNVFHLYTLNIQTGEMEPHTNITYMTDWKGNQKQGKTNANGLLSLPLTIHTQGSNSSMFILPKATKNKSTAFMTERSYFYFHRPDPVTLYTETDRAIYRPGQTVHIALYALQQAGRGLKPLPENSQVQLTVRDTNYEKVLEQTLSLNAYGTAQTQLTLPETGLLGDYRIELSYKLDTRAIRGYGSFQVEEYKRPEYEVTLDQAATLQYGKETKISGNARYYFGAPVENAEVTYTITRRYYRPVCWWWRFLPSAQPETLVSAKTHTDKNGQFTLDFTPQPGTDKTWPTQFEVSVSVRDDSGRSIDANQTYRASDKLFFFGPSFEKGFYDANTPGLLAQVQITDVNNQPIAGKFTADIIELENKLSGASEDKNSLENWYGSNKEIRPVQSQSFTVEKGQKQAIFIPALSEGIYKLKLSAKNADSVELVFLVTNSQSALDLPDVAIAQQETYYPGSQAKILIGARSLRGKKHLEIYDDGQFLAKRDTLEPGATVYTLPIENAWRGGVGIRWFGASNYQLHSAHTFLQIPHDNKALSLKLDLPKTVQPGATVHWNLSAKNAAGAPVNAQASVRVYDKSLDYYAAVSPVLSLDRLYPTASLSARFQNSFITSPVHQHYTAKTSVTHLNAPTLPRLNLQMYFARYNLGFAPRMMAMAKSAMSRNAATADMAVEEASLDMGVEAEYTMAAGTANQKDTSLSAEVTSSAETPRTDFSETAYFNPMLPITGGKGQLSFKMPQSLTAWKVMGFALTPDINFGSFTAQTVTQKDLMVRLSLPRFWREGDKSSLVAQITNMTARKQTAEITLDVRWNGQPDAARFGLSKLTQTVTVPAQGNMAITWPIQVPAGVGILQATVTVRSGKEADAESREIPILPAQERIAESVTVALEDGTKTLQLENLLTPDDSRRVSTLNLRLDPSLLLTVLNAMPQLLQSYYSDALSLANRYVPLAVINGFYTAYPELKRAVANLPKRNTQTPVWDSTDPARLVLLTETPWLHLSQGGAGREAFLSDVFNPATVEKTRQRIEKELAKYQTASGGFSWMPGGEASEFITLRLLGGYAQILRYGGQIPQESAQRALAWLAPRIEKNLQEDSGSASAVAYALYATYVFTAYPQEWKAIRSASVRQWLDYADQHAKYMTPLGQTYAAAAYYRLGEQTKANYYLDLVLSQLKTDPVTGAYFAPEALSWLWYNDTLFTQTATLRTLLEIRPQAQQATELVKWLLFNRKAQMWRDTATTAEVVYSLLEYMQRRGLVNQPADYTLVWGNQTEKLHFKPFDWAEPLRWTQESTNVSPSFYTAQVSKKGGLTGFASLDAVYTTAHAKASQPGVLNVQRRYLLKYQENGRDKVRALQEGEEIEAGSEIEVELTLQTSSAFDFVLLSDPKPAGFENTELSSGWTWNALSYYQEIRDAATHFFINRVPAGTYTLRYLLRPSLAGKYQVLPAQVQSMYAPEFSAHTATDQLQVK